MERKVLNEFTVKWLPIGSGLALFFFLIVYISLPKIYNVFYSEYRHPAAVPHIMRAHVELIAQKARDAVSPVFTKKDFIKFLSSGAPELRENIVQGGQILEEATPGNYTIEDKGNGRFILTFYDFIGRPIIYEILPEKKKKEKSVK